MILGAEAKGIASSLRSTCGLIFEPIAEAFAVAVLNCRSEVKFFKKLIRELRDRLNGFELPLAKFSCRIAEIHQKPLVQTDRYRCELGDLMITVKYHPLHSRKQAKTVIYQAKMSEGRSRVCKIDQNQLNLLRTWPTFRFGRKRQGGVREYSIRPRTIEFGSYMLEPRNAQSASEIGPWELDVPLEYGMASGRWRKTFGLCPTAWDCFWEGPKRIDLAKQSHLLPDADAVLGQILFSRGEHHSNREARDLVRALYRYVGLAPDPPAEFTGFSRESQEDGFAVLEINVEQKVDLYETFHEEGVGGGRRHTKPRMPRKRS